MNDKYITKIESLLEEFITNKDDYVENCKGIDGFSHTDYYDGAIDALKEVLFILKNNKQ